MKKANYLIFSIILFFSFMFFVQASCSEDELKQLKEESSNIKVTYKHLGAVEDNDMIYHNRFDMKIKNVSDDFYLLYLDTIKLEPVDGEIKNIVVNGNYHFDIYSNKCNEKISELNVYIPKFNIYSSDPICDGVDTNEFPLCGKYYEYDVSYEDFIARLNFYLANHKTDNEDIVEDVEVSKDYLFIVLNLLLKYRIYILLTLCIILLVLLILIIKRRREKNSILK